MMEQGCSRPEAWEKNRNKKSFLNTPWKFSWIRMPPFIFKTIKTFNYTVLSIAGIG